jgi:hypothetical protein
MEIPRDRWFGNGFLLENMGRIIKYDIIGDVKEFPNEVFLEKKWIKTNLEKYYFY